MATRTFSTGDDWMAAYTAVLARGPVGPPKKEGPGCCPICCTLFSIFAALFLFIIAAAMKNEYQYMNIGGDLNEQSRSVAYAGCTYLVFAFIAIFFWLRGIAKHRSQYGRVQ